MPLQTCPTEIFHATASRVWEALTIPREMERWMGVRILDGPTRSLEAGDRLVLGAGLGGRIKVYFDIKEAVRPSKFAFDASLPLGIVNHEVVQISAIDAAQCRVTFN
jgi:uncharacterized protein YndB with AHSA1/START domain